MNSDIRIKTSFRDHRKRKKLQLRLGAEGVLAFIDLMLMVAETRPDGILHGMDAEDVALDANWQGDPHEFLQILVSVGLIDENEEGVLSIHDWREHNAYAASAEERSESARKAAKARWAKRDGKKGNAASKKEQSEGMESDELSSAELCGQQCGIMRPAQKRNAPSPSPSPSPNPEDKSSPDGLLVGSEAANETGKGEGGPSQDKPDGPKQPSCPHQEIIALYHEVLPELPGVKIWNSDRQSYLRARWREDAARQSLDWWRGYFEYVRGCPHLMGTSTNGDWQADLEWLVRPRNFVKVVEGRYEPRLAHAG